MARIADTAGLRMKAPSRARRRHLSQGGRSAMSSEPRSKKKNEPTAKARASASGTDASSHRGVARPTPRRSRSRRTRAAALGRRRSASAKACSIRRRAWCAPMRSSSRATSVDPREILARTFSEVDGYDEMIVLKDIRFESYCEHHMVPIIGRAHVAYLPKHPRGRHFEAGAARRCVRQASADPGKDDRADRRYAQRECCNRGASA